MYVCVCYVLEIEKCIQYLLTYEDFGVLSVWKTFRSLCATEQAEHAHIAQNNFLLFSKVNMWYVAEWERERAAFEEKPGIVVEKDTVAIIPFSFVCFTLWILLLIDDS